MKNSFDFLLNVCLIMKRRHLVNLGKMYASVAKDGIYSVYGCKPQYWQFSESK